MEPSRALEVTKILSSLRPLLLEGFSWTPGATGSEHLHTEAKTSFRDLVTIYDKKVEDVLIEKLSRTFPGEVIIGEESCAASGKKPKELSANTNSFWLIDPIDGTTNFSRSYPFFCSTISFVEKVNGRFIPQVAATFNPVSNEMFHATRGHGAYLDRTRLRVSSVADKEQALLTTGFASLRATQDPKSFQLFSKLTQETLGVRRDGSAALDLAFVAAGRIDAYWEWGLSPWDIAAGWLLVEESGGSVTHHDGNMIDIFSGEILSSNERLHKWIMDKIKEQG